MSIKASKFPDEVWDGTTESTKSLTDDKRPDNYDFDRIRQEIIAVQRHLFNQKKPFVTLTPSSGHVTPNLNSGSYFQVNASASFTLDNPTNNSDTSTKTIEIWIKNTGVSAISITLDTLYQKFTTDTGSLGANKSAYLKATYFNSKWYINDYNAEP